MKWRVPERLSGTWLSCVQVICSRLRRSSNKISNANMRQFIDSTWIYFQWCFVICNIWWLTALSVVFIIISTPHHHLGRVRKWPPCVTRLSLYSNSLHTGWYDGWGWVYLVLVTRCYIENKAMVLGVHIADLKTREESNLSPSRSLLCSYNRMSKWSRIEHPPVPSQPLFVYNSSATLESFLMLQCTIWISSHDLIHHQCDS